MIAWSRAVSWALLLHAAVFFLFIFTFKGVPGSYQVDLVFWGSILRPQEVVPSLGGASGPVDELQVMMGPEPGDGLSLWGRGILVDKPELSRSAAALGEESIPRFSGERVELDEQQNGFSQDFGEEAAEEPVTLRSVRP